MITGNVAPPHRSLLQSRSATTGYRASPSWLFLFWTAVVFLFMAPFALQLGGVDPRQLGAAAIERPTYIYVWTLGALVTAAVALARRAVGLWLVVTRILPVLVFLFWCALSATWSDDPYLTLRSTYVLSMAIFVSVCLVATVDEPTACRVILAALALAALMSIVTVVLAPTYGVHNAVDAYQGSHVGRWRGVFRHKNQLGHVSGMLVTLAVCFGKRLLGWMWKWPAVLLGSLCLLMSQSASGMFLVFSGCAFYLAAFQLRGPARIVTITALAVILAATLLLGEQLFEFIAELLHRDITLTGRTRVWEVALHDLGSSWLAGRGYGTTGFSRSLREMLQATFNVSDVHNGFLDMTTNVGVIGLALLLLSVGFAFGRSIRQFASSGGKSVPAAMWSTIMFAWITSATVEVLAFATFSPLAIFGFAAVVSALATAAPTATVRNRVS